MFGFWEYFNKFLNSSESNLISFESYDPNLCTCWINKRPMLNNAHDAATNKGAAITNKRVSINSYPL